MNSINLNEIIAAVVGLIAFFVVVYQAVKMFKAPAARETAPNKPLILPQLSVKDAPAAKLPSPGPELAKALGPKQVGELRKPDLATVMPVPKVAPSLDTVLAEAHPEDVDRYAQAAAESIRQRAKSMATSKAEIDALNTLYDNHGKERAEKPAANSAPSAEKPAENKGRGEVPQEAGHDNG